MGNSSTKHIADTSVSNNQVLREKRNDHSQLSLSSFIGSFSGRSFISTNSNYSVYSASRPWSRVSRRRWNDSTLTDPLRASRTAWPVANIESFFLPEFKIDCDTHSKQFKYLDTISKGAFGKVYKVYHVESKKLFALKILLKSQIISENCVKQVKDEVHIQEVCGHHPFIVSCFLKWQSRKRLYIVTEFISGGELSHLLEKYLVLPEELVRLYVAEIALIIDFLHNAGIVYRDLKPENLLINARGHIQLIDFGLSKWLKFGCKTNTICGTLNYMAPEVISREPYGHSVDWWSLGVVMYKMFTSEYPKTDGSMSEEIKKLLVSDPAQKLLLRLLEKNPVHRLRTLKTLGETAFFQNYNFDDVRNMKVNPIDVLHKYFPEDAPQQQSCEIDPETEEVFLKFNHVNFEHFV